MAEEEKPAEAEEDVKLLAKFLKRPRPEKKKETE